MMERLKGRRFIPFSKGVPPPLITEENPSEPLQLVFRHRCSAGDFGCPDLAEVAEEARWLAEPAVAIVAVLPWHGGPGRGLLVTAGGASREDDKLMCAWLRDVTTSGQLAVPSLLRARFGALHALAIPLRGADRVVGALALPLRAAWGPIARELEQLGSDFAIRFEAADRRAQITQVRSASTGRRPTGRREHATGTAHPPQRILAASGAPRARAGSPGTVDGDSSRRAEPPAGVLMREGPLAVGRR
jgi:hypothetical protein